MVLSQQHWILQKHGTDRCDCEDALDFSLRKQRFAVADGATEAFDSKTWAKLLVRCWLTSSTPLLTSEEFWPMVQRASNRLHGRWNLKALPWYAEEKASRGSFAAFVGLQIHENQDGWCWSALALGDCCLFQLREGRILCSFPLTNAEQFGFRPELVPSSPSFIQSAHPMLALLSGKAEAGDVFLLMSDALAQWFLSTHASNSKDVGDFDTLLRGSRISELDLFMDELRSISAIRNDDVAVIRVELSSTAGKNE